MSRRLALTLMTLLACQERPSPTSTATTPALLVREPGAAAPQVRVHDLDGRVVADVQVSWDERMVEARAAGWSTALSGRQSEDGDPAYTGLILAPLEVETLRFNAEGGAAALAGGLHIQLAPEAIVDEDGRDVAGEVTLHVALLDDERELVAAPGPWLLEQDGGEVALGIYSAMEIGLRDGQNPVWPDTSTTISIPLPASADPERSSLALYAYDEDAGRWRVAGPVAVVDGRFVADVEHAGWFAVGTPMAEAPMVGEQCVTAILLDAEDSGASVLPGLGLTVIARLSGGLRALERVTTDADGKLYVTVPTRTLVKLTVYDPRYQWSSDLFRTKRRPASEVSCTELGRVVPLLVDLDGDEYAGEAAGGPDCDDSDDTVHPFADDAWYDGVDSDCDDGDDFDADGDGVPADGYDTDGDGDTDAEDGGDCDDADPDRFDTNPEVCGDALDNDCDDLADADDPDATDASTWYLDKDADGYGSAGATGTLSCDRLTGYADNATDCDDKDSAIHPDQRETDCADGVDNNCDGTIDGDRDDDDDGYGACSGDCDDDDATSYSGAAERCDDKDNDCDSLVDEDVVYTWYRDRDSDAHGSLKRVIRDVCDPPGGFVESADDCDDRPGAKGRSTFPGAAPLDSTTACMRDRDGDEFGDLSAILPIAAGTDCDDRHRHANPAAFERCDPRDRDEDCDGAADDEDTGWDEDLFGEDTASGAGSGTVEEDDGAPRRALWLRDADADHYGDAEDWVFACEEPDGYLADGEDFDCDDSDSAVNPGAAELCNGKDDDCDETTDEDATDAETFYADEDEDGFGDPDATQAACEALDGYVDNAEDCDDNDDDTYLGAPETCNGEDDDCDGDVDNHVGEVTGYRDTDGDGYGDSSSTLTACALTEGYVAEGGDCDDGDRSISPAAEEIAGDGINQDCAAGELCYVDADGDGARSTSISESTDEDCTDEHEALASAKPDCDDADSTSYPGAAEICGDGVVNDCDGTEEEAGTDCGWDDDMSLSEADARLTGEATGDEAGQSASGSHDINGDSVPDLIIGAYSNDAGGPGAGAVYLNLGPVTGEHSLSDADAQLIGEAGGDYAGWFALGAGDVDGDGYDDLSIGAPFSDAGGSSSGAVYVVQGPVTGARALDDSDTCLAGESSGDLAGQSSSGASAGDIDGDNLDDLVIGAWYNDAGGSRSGSAYLVLGPVSAERTLTTADARLAGESAGDHAGYAVTGAGDLDGDGLEDLAVGAVYNDAGGLASGAAYVVLGPASGVSSLSDADARLIGESAGDVAGSSLSAAGDVNDDGLGDLIVGADLNEASAYNAGAAYLLLGPISGDESLSEADARLTGEYREDRAGISVSGVGDVDADGFDDVAIGAFGSDAGGAAYLVLGPISGEHSLTDADARFVGEAIDDQAGRSVSGAGDINADGRADLVIGAHTSDAGGLNSGAAYLLLSPSFQSPPPRIPR